MWLKTVNVNLSLYCKLVNEKWKCVKRCRTNGKRKTLKSYAPGAIGRLGGDTRGLCAVGTPGNLSRPLVRCGELLELVNTPRVRCGEPVRWLIDVILRRGVEFRLGGDGEREIFCPASISKCRSFVPISCIWTFISEFSDVFALSWCIKDAILACSSVDFLFKSSISISWWRICAVSCAITFRSCAPGIDR